MMELKDSVALVTGAGSGIGKAIALRFAEEGAKVVVNDLTALAMKETASEIRERCGRDVQIIEYAADVSRFSDIQTMVDTVVRQWGTIDILANTVGMGSLFVIQDIPAEVWDRNITITLSSAFYCCKAVAPIMIEHGRGKIISIGSTAGVRMSTSAGVDYTAAKYGLQGLNHTLAFELAKYGINVNVINPGMTRTPRNTNYMAPEQIKKLERDIPMGKFCEPEDIAETALFLASDRSRMITGQAISVDGGWTLGLALDYPSVIDSRLEISRTKAAEWSNKNT
ncbi:MAG: SDR family oxidoreductase [Spirochaetales bacterium]|nr:SDR family oxidoreductase [Spirochaetales bacterium]